MMSKNFYACNFQKLHAKQLLSDSFEALNLKKARAIRWLAIVRRDGMGVFIGIQSYAKMFSHFLLYM